MVNKLIPPAIVVICLLSACDNKPAARKDVKLYSAEQLYNNKSIGGVAYNAAETGILINSNVTGIYNLYELNLVDTVLKPLTQSKKESFYAIDYLPGTNKFLYSADRGGDENSHIYLQAPGDTAAKDITPWPGSTNNMYGWSVDKQSIYVTGNRRDPKYFDLWKGDTTGWNFTLFYQNDSGYSPGVISSSERYITLTKEITTDKNELYLYDRINKTSRRISNDNEATWNGAAFEKNDSILYYITNDGDEFSYVVKYNINSGTAGKFYSAKCDVAYMSLSENEQYHTIFINEDGKNKVQLYDHAANQLIDFPEIKDGDIKGVTISPSEKNMMLSVGSSRSPNNIYTYNFETKTLKQLTQTLNPEVDVNDLVSADVIRFKSFDGKEIPAIYYKPLTASKDNKVPAILTIHGGPGGQSRIGFSNEIQYFVNHGYAVLAVNNRGSSGYGKLFYKLDNKDHSNGDLKDCVWAKKWLQQQDYIDTAKSVFMGVATVEAWFWVHWLFILPNLKQVWIFLA
ncbi:MAG: prolyl oligopeptidase family serine peptidase [Ferruginibacter sp.]